MSNDDAFLFYDVHGEQAKLHSNVNDASLIYQGFLWKRDGATETRHWALLFNDAMLLTHVSIGRPNAGIPRTRPLAISARSSALIFSCAPGEQRRPLRGRGARRPLQRRSRSG